MVVPTANVNSLEFRTKKLGTIRRKEEREAALAAAAKKADEAPVIVKEIMPTRKRAGRLPSGPQPPPALRRFKSVQGGKEVLLHVSEGDSVEGLLGQSGFRLYKRNLSEPAPPLDAASPADPAPVRAPKMVRLPSSAAMATLAAETATTGTKGKADFLLSPPLDPVVPELRRSDSDEESGAPDEAPLNLSLPRDVMRTVSAEAEADVLTVEEKPEATPQGIVRPAAIPALMPIREGDVR